MTATCNTDIVAQSYDSLGLMTADGKAGEAVHDTVTRHFRQYQADLDKSDHLDLSLDVRTAASRQAGRHFGSG